MKRFLLSFVILLLTCGVVSAAQQPVTVGTAESQADIDVNFQNIQSNFNELYDQRTRWSSGVDYTADNQLVAHNGNLFICILDHTSSAAGAVGNEPGVGDSWDTYWKYSGSDRYQPILSEGAFQNGDKDKLDGIEAGATGDQTGAEIKVLYEAEADTNAFTDAEKTLLGNQSGVNTGDQSANDFNHDGLANITGTSGQYNHPNDAQMVVLGNTSGVNTGDQDLSGKEDALDCSVTGQVKKWNATSGAWECGSDDTGAGGADATAIHDDTAGEISLLTEKASPVSGDLVIIEDSADSYNKKKVQIGNLPSSGGTDDQAITDFSLTGDTLSITLEGDTGGAHTVDLSGYQSASANLDTYAAIAPSANMQAILAAADYAAMRTLLDLEVGVDFNAYDANMILWPSAISATEISILDGWTKSGSVITIPASLQTTQADTYRYFFLPENTAPTNVVSQAFHYTANILYWRDEAGTDHEVVTDDETQTLENKDLTDPSNTFPTLNQNTTGNAATASALETARNIGGVSFDGTADINLPGVNTTGNQDTSGNAATCTTAGTGDSATGFFPSGELEDARIPSTITRDTEVQTKYLSGTEADWHGTLMTPQGVYDIDSTNHAFTIINDVPAAFTITEINISCDADPTTELTITFQHKAAGVGYASATTIEAVTTTAGVATITSGIDDATIPAGTKVFGTLSDPDDALLECAFQIEGDWD